MSASFENAVLRAHKIVLSTNNVLRNTDMLPSTTLK
ncbi:MAG: hypothetical protein ACI9BW_003907 [Gammaproteobacteria bacterium]|jgi:hypothetical protein